MRLKNLNKLIIAHVNINSIRAKFEQISFIIRDNVDILVVGETKLDDTFPKNQFLIEDYSQPYRSERNRNGCGGGGGGGGWWRRGGSRKKDDSG